MIVMWKKTIIFLLLIAVCNSAQAGRRKCVSAEQELTVESFLKKQSEIEHKVRTDLSAALENVEDLSIVVTPVCYFALKNKNEVTLIIADDEADAVIFSGEKRVAYVDALCAKIQIPF